MSRGRGRVRRALQRVGALGLLLVGASCSGEGGGGVPRPVEVGKPAPPYRGVTLGGDSVSLDQRRGKVVLLNVWATWCTPCRDEIPALQRLHERYATQGLELVGVSVDAEGEDDKIRGFIREFGMTYPIWRDPAERVSSTFLVVGVPATFVIDRTGTLLFKHTGPIKDTDAKLVDAIERGLRS